MIASGLMVVIHTPNPARVLMTEWPAAFASRGGQFPIRAM